jgi:hypothetical protein
MEQPDSVNYKDYVDAAVVAIRDNNNATIKSTTDAIQVIRGEQEHRFSSIIDRIAIQTQSANREFTAIRENTVIALEGVKNQFSAVTESAKIARESMEKRFDSVNEFRAQLKDQASTFMPRNEIINLLENLTRQVGGIESRLTSMEAQRAGANEVKHDTKVNYNLILAAMAVAVSLIVASFAFIHSSTPIVLPAQAQQAQMQPHQ